MATTSETMYVSDDKQLQATVQTLLARGGVVEGEGPGVQYISLKKRKITVKVGSPTSIRTEHTHWYDKEAVDGLAPGTVPTAPPAPDDTGQWPPAGTAPAAPAGGGFGAPPTPPPGFPGGPAAPVPETDYRTLPPPPAAAPAPPPPPAPSSPTDKTLQIEPDRPA